MADINEEASEPRPNPMNLLVYKHQRPHPPQPAEPEPKIVPDPDRFLMQAKQLVVENYNNHRDLGRSEELSMGSVYIVWFAKTLSNWKAIVASPVARGLMWEVTYNGNRGEAYIDIYKKLNNVRVPTGGFHSA
jgi:hypothetical protein